MTDVLNNIGFDWQVALANFINFLIIFWILKRFVFGPVGKILEERKETIQSGIDKAQQSETELLVAQQKAEAEIKTARSEANQIVAKAKEQGDRQKEQAEHDARKKAESIIEKAHAQLAKDTIEAEKELLEKTAHLITLGVEKILHENMDDQETDRVNKRSLDALKERV